jgi:hypothetical protein
MSPDAERNIARFVDLVMSTIARKQQAILTYRGKKGNVDVRIQKSNTPGHLKVDFNTWSTFDMSPAACEKVIPGMIEYHCESLEPKEEATT